MGLSKFTETPIASILKEADAGRPVNEIWRTMASVPPRTTSEKRSTAGWTLPM